MNDPIHGISSKATQALLAELAQRYGALRGVAVAIESVGGVDAARRVMAGEAFDVVVLAADAIESLAAAGRVRRDTITPMVRSVVAIAVRAGAPRPDVGSVAALQAALLAARSIGYSTGPSGTALLALFERWGLADALRGRLVQAPPGVPVGALVERGDAEIGLQQRSELMHQPGIVIVGGMPDGAAIVTTFSAATAATSARPDAVRELLDFLASAATADAKRAQGLEPA